MKHTGVVDLGAVRNVLSVWDEVRAHLVKGEVDRFHVTLGGPDGNETVYIGGVFKEDAEAWLRSALRMSAIRMMKEDEPPKFCSSQS